MGQGGSRLARSRWRETIGISLWVQLNPVLELLQQGGDEAADANKKWAAAIQRNCPNSL